MAQGIRTIINGSRYGAGNFSPDVPVDVSRFATVTAVQPAEHVSSKYRFIPTTRPLSVLADCGWFPVAVAEAGTRVEGRIGFQKHIVRLAHPDYNREMTVGGTIPQIVLSNEHSGGAAFEFLVGLYEKVCKNQLCVARGEAARITVRHVGYADRLVEECVRRIMAELPAVLGNVERFKCTRLSLCQQLNYAAKAIELRWDGDAYSVSPSEIVAPRHFEQREPTLWNTFNRVQESVIRGGVKQVNAQGRKSRARGIRSVDEDIRINRGLWTLTEATADEIDGLLAYEARQREAM